MKPILFDKTATQFNTNGLGRLEAISCVVTEERNGLFELEMTIAETALHTGAIEMQSIIVVKVPDKQSLQAFRVYKITKPVNGIFAVFAQHISYQLSFIPTMPFAITASASACNLTLQALKSNAVESCPFTFTTDVTTVASYQQTAPASIRSRLGGVAGSVLDQFGGEYSWDNFDVYLLANRGVTTPAVTLRYGKNITDLNQEENIADTITGIVPYWQSSEGDTMVTLPEKVIDSSHASQYPFKRTVPYDFSQAFEEEPTEAQLRAKAQAYMNASGVGVPEVSIKLSFINLADTEEYKDVAALQSVKLCDNIGVYFEKLGISTTAEIVKYQYNVLSEKYDSIEVGSLRTNLAGAINANSEGIQQLANNTHRMFKEYNGTVSQLVDSATAWLTNGDGFVVATKDNSGNWKELFFMDTADMETAHNVLRINQNGIGFSSTGVAGPYTQAWTLDGKLVVGGTNVPSLTVYDNNQNILFQINASGMQWNAANSSMTTAGLITAVGAHLNQANVQSGVSGTLTQINIDNGEIGFGEKDSTTNVYPAHIKYEINQVREGHQTYNIDTLEIFADDSIILSNNHYSSIEIYHNQFLSSDNSDYVQISSGSSDLRIREGSIDLQASTSSQFGATLGLGTNGYFDSPNELWITSEDLLRIQANNGSDIELYTATGQILLNQNNPICGFGVNCTLDYYDVQDADEVTEFYCDVNGDFVYWYLGFYYTKCS